MNNWKITEDKRTKTDAPLIVCDYVEFLRENEFEPPILYYGLNKEGAPVFGVSVDTDTEKQCEIFVHAVVEGYDAIAFFNRQMNVTTLMQKARELFRIDEYHVKGVQLLAVYKIAYDDLPVENRPLESAYFPKWLSRTGELIRET